MDKLKVAHIITQLELGGAQENTLYTVTHLPPQSYECFLVSGQGGHLDNTAVKNLEKRVIFVPSLNRPVNPWKDLLALLAIYRICRKEKFDLVHTHSSKAGILGRWAAKLAGVKKIVHTYHGFGFNDFQKPWTKWLFIWIERFTAYITDVLVVVSAENTKKALANKIGKIGQYIVIHSGIKAGDYQNLNIDKAREKKKIGLPEQAPVVGMIACFKPQKAPLDFVRIAQLVKVKIPQVKFVMIGDGELRPAIESLVAELSLKDTVKLLGWRDDIPVMIKLMDVCVLTSLWEGLPRVILEAFVSGVPVVATPADGTREVVKHGLTGYLAGFHDLTAFTALISACLESPEKNKKIVENAGNLITGSFNIDTMVQDIANLYESLRKNTDDR
ncbi:MAG: glycosyltransferase family 4 protein [bacterium]|nr:glycosyltransferase family 4 protein [bacterium]